MLVYVCVCVCVCLFARMSAYVCVCAFYWGMGAVKYYFCLTRDANIHNLLLMPYYVPDAQHTFCARVGGGQRHFFL